MLRRVVQKNTGSTICRRAVKCNHVRHVSTSASFDDKKTSYRRGRDDGARQLGAANPTVSPSALTQSSERYSSSEAALYAMPAHHGFLRDILHGEGSNEMISPFLRRSKTDSDNGFLELFKAISTLNNRHNDFNPTLSMSINLSDTEIYSEEREETVTSSSGADIKNIKVQGDDPPVQDTFISLSERLDKAIKESCTKSVIDAFEEERTSSKNELSDKQLGRIITFLADRDVVMSFEVTKYQVQQCKVEGRMVPLFLYHYMMSGLKNCRSKNEAERLASDIQEHIIEEYSDGKKAVYKYILLPQLALNMERLNFHDSARPLVEYFLGEKYPLLNPDIYESLLKTAWRNPFARDDWAPTLPYHRLLSELVSCGHRPEPELVTKVLHIYYPYRGE